jgi:2-oxoglutarate ferredoxin oxidoreductase subunit alpha
MSDMYLSESHKSVEKSFVDKFISQHKINRGKLINKIINNQSPISKKYLRYQITDDGISPRLIPGTPGYFFQANSYEHLEDGHTSEDAKPRLEQVDKRARKLVTYLAEDFSRPKIYGDLEKSEIVFISWGSTKGIVIEAQKQLKIKNTDSAFIHFNHIYPLDNEKVKSLFKENKKYILVENNSWGQFGKLLMMETGFEIKEKILRYDGRAITAEEIVDKVIKFIKS